MGDLIWLNDIYPYPLPEPPDEKKILFSNLPIAEQKWRRTPIPDNWDNLPQKTKSKFIEQEVDRMFVTGLWFMNKGRKVYLTPDAYFYFNYWKMKDGNYPNFRYSQLYEIYFENFAESIPNCIGTFSFKKRRDGRTTRRMCRMVWKAIQPKNRNSKLGMQSKTGTDAKDICWEILTNGFKALPIWVKPDIAGSSDPKTQMEFAKPSQRLSRANVRKVLEEQSRDDDSLNTIINWRDTTQDAYDGDELLDYTCDEVAKWKKANVLKSFGTYTKCFWKDGVKVGHWHGITSPSEKNGVEHERSVAFWNMGDPSKSLKINKDGTFEVLKKSWFILRYFTSALDGYGGACDEYGDCDAVKANELIEEEIGNAEAELKSELRRQLPKSIEEILINTEDLIFTMGPEMLLRKTYLESIHYRDEIKKAPKYIYYNLEWKDGIRFGEAIEKPSKNQDCFSETGRFCFQKLPPQHMRNKMIAKRKGNKIEYFPADDSENVIGGDPYDYRRTESSHVSQGGAIGGCALDLYDHGCKDDIYFAYLFRPKKPSTYYEDMILACWYLSAYFQVESKNKNIIDHFEDSGCMGLMLAKNPKQQQTSEHKGNATTVPLIDEFCTLIDSYYSIEENLEKMWMEFVLHDNLVTFDPSDTKKAHLTMAQGQFHLGVMKRRLVTRNKRLKKITDQGRSIHRSLAHAYGLNT
jgi:hypothetical protein